MRKLSLTVLALAMAFACQTFSSLAAKPVATSTTPVGVTVAVTTSGYEFTPQIGVLISPPTSLTVKSTAALPPQGFTASVALQNHTSGGITCSLGVTLTPGEKFEFTVYDSNGNVVWDSLPSVLPPLEELVVLPAGDTWNGSAFVPLFINGKALPAGTYTLEASLFGSPEFSATTSFIVHNVIAIN